VIAILILAAVLAITPEQERELEKIATLGYVAGTSPAGESGVLVHDPELAYPGHTLYTSARRAEALLIDMDGEVVHRWASERGINWTRARLFENGNLLVISRGAGLEELFMLDKDSRLVWVFPGRVHHDAVVADGRIYAIGAGARELREINRVSPVRDDLILTMSLEGELLSSVSVYDCFANTPEYAGFFEEHPPANDRDFLHTNSIEILGAEAPVPPEFRGRALISIRNVSTIAVIDLKREEVVWTLRGSFRKQHEARLVGGNILLFDNLGPGEQSRVIEIDPTTREIVWSYTEDGFFSKGAGAEQRLPNGNTLVTESDRGRIVEVTEDGRVVWEYVNPRTTLVTPEITMGIMRAERIPPGYPLGWAEPPAGP
jgi:outer membrane protein assembly factor BamB